MADLQREPSIIGHYSRKPILTRLVSVLVSVIAENIPAGKLRKSVIKRCMFSLLIDTCVWLDIAKDRKRQTLLIAIERLLEHSKIRLIVPRIVADEFARNKPRIVQDSTRSMSSTLRRAKELVEQFGKGAKARRAIEEIDNVDFWVPTPGDSAVDAVVRIEKLFSSGPILEIRPRRSGSCAA